MLASLLVGLLAETSRVADDLPVQESSGVLLRSFLIALVLVAPFAAWQWYRIRSRRAGNTTGRADSEAGGSTGTSGEAGRDGDALEHLVASIPALAATTPQGATASLEVPAGATLEGRPADPGVSRAIVGDALARGGFEVLDVRPQPGTYPRGTATLFRCRRL